MPLVSIGFSYSTLSVHLTKCLRYVREIIQLNTKIEQCHERKLQNGFKCLSTETLQYNKENQIKEILVEGTLFSNP